MKDEERISFQLEVWKKTVEVQQHFNGIELRIRGLALSILTAILGGAVLAARFGLSIMLLDRELELASGIMLLGALIWGAFYLVDEMWYHRLLLGAVHHAEELEDLLKESVPGIGLTRRIRHESPYTWDLFGKTFKVHSRHKIRIFYGSVASLLVTGAVLLELGASGP